MTSPVAQVIQYPPYEIITLVAEEGLTRTEQVSGPGIDANSIAIMKVTDPTGRFVCREWVAEYSTLFGAFVWDIGYDELDYLQHGSRYRIFIVGSNGKRTSIRHGLLIWIGR